MALNYTVHQKFGNTMGFARDACHIAYLLFILIKSILKMNQNP